MDEGSRFGHSRGDRMLGLGELSIDSDREGGVHAIRLTGELDLATATALQRELDRAEAGDADPIVLDLSGLKFVDSSGVRLLVEASSRARALTATASR